jgi:hypothetical protein
MGESSSSTKDAFAKIEIQAGVFRINYEGPFEFLKDLPALIEELQKVPFQSPPAPPAPQ